MFSNIFKKNFMRYSKIPESLFIKNRKRLGEKLENNSVAIINANDRMPRNGDQNYKYRQNSDLFYLTGIEQEETKLLIYKSPEGETGEILFILKADPMLEIWEGHKLSPEEAEDISGLQNIKLLPDFELSAKEIILAAENIYLNTNEYAKYTTPVPYADLRFIEQMKKKYPLHNYKRLAPILKELRLIKQEEEIELIKQACRITQDAFLRVLNFVKPGVKEYEVEAEMTYEFIRRGANGHAYEPIVASGKDNCALHYNSNDKTCKDGELLLMDFGAEYAGYAADTSRTIPVNGKYGKRQREVYDAVLRVFKKAVKLIKPGTSINEINQSVNKLIEEELIKLNLLSKKDIEKQDENKPARMKYFMHGNSHFMGLDVHDVGTKNTKLQAGMVLSCEPGIYIAEEGFGIRLENDILVKPDGQCDLLADEPIEADEIERLMKK